MRGRRLGSGGGDFDGGRRTGGGRRRRGHGRCCRGDLHRFGGRGDGGSDGLVCGDGCGCRGGEGKWYDRRSGRCRWGGGRRRSRDGSGGHFLDGSGGREDFGKVVHLDPDGCGRGGSDLAPFAIFAAGHDGRTPFKGAHHIVLNARAGADLDAARDDAVALDKVLVEPKAEPVGRGDGCPVAIHPGYEQDFAGRELSNPMGVGRGLGEGGSGSRGYAHPGFSG